MIRILNAGVVDAVSGNTGIYNLEVGDGVIVKMQKEAFAEPITDSDRVIDAGGAMLTQGFCDVHVHFRDPGFEYKEDILTGAAASARGGYTDVVMMANTKPSIDNVETLKYVLDKGLETPIHVHACGAVTKGLQGSELTDMELLFKNGAIGFTDDGIPLMDEALLERALIRAKELDVPVSLHEEDKSYIKENGINHGAASEHFGIYGSPREAESSLISRDVEVAVRTGARLNVQHISTKEGVEAVRNAKARCNSVFAEVTPHHMALTEEATFEYGTNAKMNPPLRTEDDRRAIIEGIKDGTISIIATDHAPHSTEEKAQEITKAPSGITGIETAFSIAYDTLVKSNELDLVKMLRMLSVNPRELYKLPVNEIKVGNPADFVIINLDEDWVFDSSLSKSVNTPFLGKTLHGKVKYTLCKGEIAYEDI